MTDRENQLEDVNERSKVSQKSLKRGSTSGIDENNDGIQPSKRPKETKSPNHETTNTSEISKRSLKLGKISGIDEQASHDGVKPGKRSKQSVSPNCESTKTSETSNQLLEGHNTSEIDDHNNAGIQRSKESQSLQQDPTSSDDSSDSDNDVAVVEGIDYKVILE